jgi:hypothetical protein
MDSMMATPLAAETKHTQPLHNTVKPEKGSERMMTGEYLRRGCFGSVVREALG